MRYMQRSSNLFQDYKSLIGRGGVPRVVLGLKFALKERIFCPALTFQDARGDRRLLRWPSAPSYGVAKEPRPLIPRLLVPHRAW